MIQLVFDADDAREALDQEPVLVGYSSHEGAERAEWDDDKLDVAGGTHPIVYPGAARTRTSSRRRSISATRPRPESAATTHGGRTASSALRSPRSRATRKPPRPPSRGSSSRAAGASSRRRSSTGRRART